MKRKELNAAVEQNKAETKEALETVLDELPPGQRKNLFKSEQVKTLMNRYGIYE